MILVLIASLAMECFHREVEYVVAIGMSIAHISHGGIIREGHFLFHFFSFSNNFMSHNMMVIKDLEA